jgi:hypothetical protein
MTGTLWFVFAFLMWHEILRIVLGRFGDMCLYGL